MLPIVKAVPLTELSSVYRERETVKGLSAHGRAYDEVGVIFHFYEFPRATDVTIKILRVYVSDVYNFIKNCCSYLADFN